MACQNRYQTRISTLCINLYSLRMYSKKLYKNSRLPLPVKCPKANIIDSTLQSRKSFEKIDEDEEKAQKALPINSAKENISNSSIQSIKSFENFIEKTEKVPPVKHAEDNITDFSLQSKKSFENITQDIEKAKKTLLDPSQRMISQSLHKIIKSLTRQQTGKISVLNLKEKRSIIDTSSFTSPYGHLFQEKGKNPSESIFKKDVDLNLSNEELKRLFLYQSCLNLVNPFQLELPLGATEANFLINPKQWEKDLFHLPIKQKSVHFFLVKWAIKNIQKRKKIAKQLEKPDQEELPVHDLSYNNKLIPMINRSVGSRWSLHRHIVNTYHDQPLVFDMRFHNAIDETTSSLVSQLNMALTLNINSCNPFRIIFNNVNKNSAFFKKWQQKLSPHFLENVFMTNKGLKGLDPTVQSEDLVYLSPDGAKEMTHFNHHKTYIIGGLVDRPIQNKRTRTISQSESIYSERLPLKRFLVWGGSAGKLELTINSVFDILLTLKQTGCWIKALSCIPYRLHSGLSEMGKEMADYNPEIIALFNRGKEWKVQKDKKNRSVVLPSQRKTSYKRTKLYLGKS